MQIRVDMVGLCGNRFLENSDAFLRFTLVLIIKSHMPQCIII